MRFVVLLLALASGLVQAQTLSCSATTPTVLTPPPGTGFTPFAPREQVLARGGNAGPAWEWAAGPDTASGQSAKGSLDWISGKVYAWKATYAAGGSVALEVRDAGVLVLNLSFASGMHTGNALKLAVQTNAAVGPDVTLSASLTAINGVPVAGAAVAKTGGGAFDEMEPDDDGEALPSRRVVLFYPPMQAGAVAEGTVSLAYASLPTGGKVKFHLRAGNVPCQNNTNVPPTVSIAAPAANSLFNAPANITVTANAADSANSCQAKWPHT